MLEEGGVDIGEVVREHLRELAFKIRAKKDLERLKALLARMPPAPGGLSARLVREDRDSH